MGRGGSESIAMWLIEALKRDFEVTVVTTGGWDRDALNACYGTRVEEKDVTVRIAPVPFPVRGLSVAALRGSCYQSYAREIAAEYDVRISAYNMTDWGLPAVHFIADFSWHQEIRDRLDPPTPGLIYRNSLPRRAYLRIAEAYQRPSGRNVLRDDLVIANSRWSDALLREHCDVDCAGVVYPPVWTRFSDVPWKEKEPGFVMIGRIVPEKQVERAIEILEAVRSRGHAIRLHICGHIGNDLYGRRIARMCRERSDWVIPEGWVSGERKARILTTCQYGIQARAAEPFGISVAEMVKAGAIVFAPNDGGQTEILNSADLLFTSVEDAASKISNVLSSVDKQVTLRLQLAQRSEMFSAEKFMERSLAILTSSRSYASQKDASKIAVGRRLEYS
jgi:glycosyltransferase involved in cell wall biosynthesis